MKTVDEFHEKWMRDPEYRKEYAALEDEFALAEALISARARAGLSQEQLAERMQTTQSVIARMESGRHMPSTRSLQRYARAVGARLDIALTPAE